MGSIAQALRDYWQIVAMKNWQYARNEKNTARTMDNWLSARHDMRRAAADYAQARNWQVDFSEYEPKPGRE